MLPPLQPLQTCITGFSLVKTLGAAGSRPSDPCPLRRVAHVNMLSDVQVRNAIFAHLAQRNEFSQGF